MEPTLQPLAPVADTSQARRGAPVSLLKGIPFFADLPDDQLKDLAAVMWSKTFARGECMYQQGGEPDGLYLLHTGEAQMWTRIGDQRKDLVRFKAGQSLCATGLVEGGLRLSSADALTETSVWVLDAKAFQGFCAQRVPAAYRALMAVAVGQAHAYVGVTAMVRRALSIVSQPEKGAPSPAPAGRAPTEADEPLLRVLPFLKNAQPEVFAELRASTTWCEVKRGTELLKEGGVLGALSIVLRGAVEGFVNTAEGKVRFALKGPGRLFGHESLFGKILQPANLVARENTVLLTIEQPALERLCTQRTQLGLLLLRQVALEFVTCFTFDTRDLLRQITERGVQISMSSEEILAEVSRGST
jgi:CRP-like cAMP-binding protein